MALTAEQQARGKALMKAWWEKNYHEPSTLGLHIKGKGVVEKWRATFRKAQAAEEQRVHAMLLNERAKDVKPANKLAKEESKGSQAEYRRSVAEMNARAGLSRNPNFTGPKKSKDAAMPPDQKRELTMLKNKQDKGALNERQTARLELLKSRWYAQFRTEDVKPVGDYDVMKELEEPPKPRRGGKPESGPKVPAWLTKKKSEELKSVTIPGHKGNIPNKEFKIPTPPAKSKDEVKPVGKEVPAWVRKELPIFFSDKPKYSPSAVQKEINKDKRIGGKEAKAIHALLKGADGGRMDGKERYMQRLWC